MKACLFPLAEVKVINGTNFLNTIDYNSIVRYSKYFKKLIVYCRVDKNKDSRYASHSIELPENIEIRPLNFHSRNFNPAQIARVYQNIIKSIVDEIDLFMSWMMPEIIYIAPCVRKFNAKLYVYCGADYYSGWKNSDSIIKKFLIHFIYSRLKTAVRYADYVHYATERTLQEVYPTNGKSIGASYVNVKLESIDHELMLRENRILNQSGSVSIGLIGYLKYIKGIDTAIKSLAMLPERFHLHILGGGNRDTFRTLAEKCHVLNRVHFYHTIEPGEPVREWIRNMDIYIQPSRTEGLPRSVIEAMSLCLPVVGSDADGLKELVKPGYMHKVGNSEELAQKLLLAEENKRELVQYSYTVVQKYNRKKLDCIIKAFFDEIEKDIMSQQTNVEEEIKENEEHR